jgi:hypothetical protein
MDESPGIAVRTFRLRMTVPDREPFPGLGASGTDDATVVPGKVRADVQATDGPAIRATKFDVVRVDEAGSASKDGPDVRVSFKVADGDAPASYLLVYACPAPFARDLVPIEYSIDLTVDDDGARDRAGNPWDLDAATDGRQGHLRYRFRVGADGRFDPDPPTAEAP